MGRAPTVGVSVDWISGAYARMILSAILQAARRRGVNVLCLDDGVRVWDLLSMPHIDGYLLCVLGDQSMRDDTRLLERLPARPMVAIGNRWCDAPLVQADNLESVRRVVRHLHVVHGHKRFAYLHGPRWNDESRQREAAFRKVLVELELPVDEDFIGDGDFQYEPARRTVRRWLRHGVRFDAIVACNDAAAFGAMDALVEARMRAPRDVAVVGFDDIDPAELVTPPLTTLRQNLQGQAELALDLLLRQMAGEKVPSYNAVPCELVVRRSCGCAYYGDARTPTLAPGPESRPPAHALEVELTRVSAPLASAPEPWAQLLSEDLAAAASRGGGELVDALDSLREQMGGNSQRWGSAVSVLLRRISCDETEMLDLWRSAGSWLGHLRGLEQGARRMEMETLASELTGLGEETAGVIDESELPAVMARHLPGFGFPSAYIVAFDDEHLVEHGSARLIMAYRDGKLVEPPRETFRAVDGLPEPFNQDFAERNFIIETLSTRQAVYGVLLLELGPDPGLIYTLMRQSISASLHSIQLRKQLVEEERRREAAERKRLERELEIAVHIQTSILPRDPKAEGLEIAALMLPASEVGGDYYEVIEVPGGAWIGIGDVAGHGLTTGIVMLMIQSLVAGLVERDPTASPSLQLATLNPVLYSSIRKRLRRDEHATLSLLRYERSGRILYAGAHEEMLLYRKASGRVEVIPTAGTWVGATADIRAALGDDELVLERGDVLLLYTDGAIEAENAAAEQYGLRRLGDALVQHIALDARTLCDALLADIRAFMAVQHDDVTLVVLRYTG
jgi:phosphoserine phosphatase RsbU/P